MSSVTSSYIFFKDIFCMYNYCNVVLHLNDFNLLCTSDSCMRTLANSEDPDEMQHNVKFYQGLQYLQSQKRS